MEVGSLTKPVQLSEEAYAVLDRYRGMVEVNDRGRKYQKPESFSQAVIKMERALRACTCLATKSMRATATSRQPLNSA